MEPMWIDNEIVHQHNLWPICGDTMQNVVEEDCPRKGYLTGLRSIDCLAMDKFAPRRHLAQGQKTGDVVIGIAERRQDGNIKSSRLQMVEVRLNYKNGRNVSYTELKNKINGTLSFLGRDIPISQNYYFLFPDKVASVAEWALNRSIYATKDTKQKKFYIIVSLSDFKRALNFT